MKVVHPFVQKDFGAAEFGDLLLGSIGDLAVPRFIVKAKFETSRHPSPAPYVVCLGPFPDLDLSVPYVLDRAAFRLSVVAASPYQFTISEKLEHLSADPPSGTKMAGWVFPFPDGPALAVVLKEQGSVSRIKFLDLASGKLFDWSDDLPIYASRSWRIVGRDDEGKPMTVYAFDAAKASTRQ